MAAYLKLTKLTDLKKKLKKITHKSIDESFFKAQSLERHHSKVPTGPRPLHALCGPCFLISSLHADYELFMYLFDRITAN